MTTTKEPFWASVATPEELAAKLDEANKRLYAPADNALLEFAARKLREQANVISKTQKNHELEIDALVKDRDAALVAADYTQRALQVIERHQVERDAYAERAVEILELIDGHMGSADLSIHDGLRQRDLHAEIFALLKERKTPQMFCSNQSPSVPQQASGSGPVPVSVEEAGSRAVETKPDSCAQGPNNDRRGAPNESPPASKEPVNVLQANMHDDYIAWKIDYEHIRGPLHDDDPDAAAKSAMARGYALGYDEGFDERPRRDDEPASKEPQAGAYTDPPPAHPYPDSRCPHGQALLLRCVKCEQEEPPPLAYTFKRIREIAHFQNRPGEEMAVDLMGRLEAIWHIANGNCAEPFEPEPRCSALTESPAVNNSVVFVCRERDGACPTPATCAETGCSMGRA